MKKQLHTFKEIEEQLSKRSADKIQINLEEKTVKNLILTSESDLGVIRNGGRRGTNFGPKAITSTIGKMTSHRDHHIKLKCIRDNFSTKSFDEQQKEDTIEITKELQDSTPKTLWHLGGGHDHIYPLLSSLNGEHKKICVINIDAHLDTRTDRHFHSGTPFRQFSNETNEDFLLYQLGIHKFANTKENYSELKNGNMKVYSTLQIQKESGNFQNIYQFLENEIIIPKDYTVVLSLDCDAIDSMTMEAVSAVNHDGLSLQTIKTIFSWYFSRNQKQNYVGIYEYNPIFDNLSNKGSRAVASLIESFL